MENYENVRADNMIAKLNECVEVLPELNAITLANEQETYVKLENVKSEYFALSDKAIEKLGAKPEECIVFEDSINGVISAKEAGLEVCAVFDKTAAGEQDLIDKIADYKVYSCPNDKALGTIVKDTVREILYKEFTVSKSWFKVRLEHESCRHCIYNTLCPPITNYELFLGKTLCNWK